MKYMGSKRRIAKDILPIMLKYRKSGQYWVEPFVGGANMIENVDGPRIGADNHPQLIKALKLIRDSPETLPDLVTEEDYNQYKKYRLDDALTGYVGFSFAFGGDWFCGYSRDRKGTKGCIENMRTQSRRSKNSAIKQSPKLKDVKFYCESYNKLIIPEKSIIYCDPPYENTTKYSTSLKFDHKEFWEWCRNMSKNGHIVFISEYNAPEDFISIWEKEVVTNIDSTNPIIKPTENYSCSRNNTKS